MKVQHGIVHVPIEQPRAEELRVLWNQFVEEWNRRERDRNAPPPRGRDPWSAIVVPWVSWAPDNRVHFRLKDEPEWVLYGLHAPRRWREWHAGWSFCRNPISVEQLVRAERLIFVDRLRVAAFKHRNGPRPSYKDERREIAHRLATDPDFWRTVA